jgi:hypothetical protein
MREKLAREFRGEVEHSVGVGEKRNNLREITMCLTQRYTGLSGKE